MNKNRLKKEKKNPYTVEKKKVLYSMEIIDLGFKL